MQTKIGTLVFTHSDLFRGDVEIARAGGEMLVSVPMAALRTIVAESVRVELADHIAKMKPDALLRRIA